MYVHTYHTRYFGESDAVASQLQSPVLAISACVLGQKSNGFGEKYHVLGSMAWVTCIVRVPIHAGRASTHTGSKT
jgi:hypothetical protein